MCLVCARDGTVILSTTQKFWIITRCCHLIPTDDLADASQASERTLCSLCSSPPAIMASVAGLLFCLSCGNLLETNADRKDLITCEVCGQQNKDISNKVIITRSKPTAFPSSLRTRLRSVVAAPTEADTAPQDATVKKACEKCNNDLCTWTAVQLRSADEGSTVFYTCTECRHKWSEQN